MIMSRTSRAPNRVKFRRSERGWSQAELASRAGVSRTAVSAIEIERLAPSVSAALALASALDCSVEELFGAATQAKKAADWAWKPDRVPCRFWRANVGGRVLLYPCEPPCASFVERDGIYDGSLTRSLSPRMAAKELAETTLAIASCDPAAAFLAAHYSRQSGFRLLVFPRSSRRALSLLKAGLVHVAGVHLGSSSPVDANANVVKSELGEGHRLLRFATWNEGLVFPASSAFRSTRAALRARLNWVGREVGSGARECLDELLGDRPAPEKLARDHAGVAEAIRCGWADAGVCVEYSAAEAGLGFLPVRREAYDLCFPVSLANDPRIAALARLTRSTSFREALAELPGYDVAETGDIRAV